MECAMYWTARRPRVAHVMDTCFALTETFVYDYVQGCRRYESWCLGKSLANLEQFRVSRVRQTTINWSGRSPGDLFDRALFRVWRNHRLPLYRALARVRPAVVHAHFGPAGYDILPACRRFGWPLLTSFYGYDASSLPRQEGWAVRLNELFRSGTRFVVEGPAMRRRIVGLGCEESKIVVVPISLHLENYGFKHRSKSHDEPLRLLFVGRFVPKKGLDILLEALGLLNGEIGDFELRVVGGPDIGPMKDLAERHGIAASTTFLGLLPRQLMLDEMDRAHLLIVPSRTAPDGDTEGGAPTVLLESQAMGLPVVSTRHADIPFVVAAGYRDYLAAEGCARSLAEQIVRLCKNHREWPPLAQAGREHVKVNHSPANFELLEREYDRMVGCAASAA